MPMIRWLIWPFRTLFALGLESSAHRLMETQEWREAREVYQRLIRWSPNQASFHTESGIAHMMLNEWEPAEERFREAIRLDPHAFRAYDFLGVLLANQGRTEEARAVWERMIAVARALGEQKMWLFERYARSHIGEAQERLAALDAPDFSGFPLDPGFNEYPGSTPGNAD
ncbi:MAG: tetratricopeptide repeat protein [Armatimonadetes bacterium]|nr:tetratricopeptide repeat protein [Armatimonadota bacterium]